MESGSTADVARGNGGTGAEAGGGDLIEEDGAEVDLCASASAFVGRNKTKKESKAHVCGRGDGVGNDIAITNAVGINAAQAIFGLVFRRCEGRHEKEWTNVRLEELSFATALRMVVTFEVAVAPK